MTTTALPRPAGRRGLSAPWAAAAGTFIVLVDFTTPLCVLRPTAGALRAGPVAQTWVLSSMGVGVAAALLAAGALADEHGRRRAFRTGLAGLAAGAVGCAAAPDAVVFVLARIVQGASGAAVIAAGLGLVGQVVPAGPDRARATGLWGAAVGAGIAAGPVLAVAGTAVGGWRAPYAAEGLAAAWAAMSAAGLPESRTGRQAGGDRLGPLLLAGSVCLLVLGLTEARSGLGRPEAFVPVLVAAALAAAFASAERRAARPVLDLLLLRSPRFATATLGGFFVGASNVALMIYMPVLLDRRLHASPAAAAAANALWAVTSTAVAVWFRGSAPALRGSRVLAAGLAVCAVGEAAMAPARSLVWLVPGLAVAGVGSGALNATLGKLAVESVPADKTAMGSGANNTARYVGSSAGLAVLVAAAARGRVPADGLALSAAVAAALSVLGAGAVLATGRADA